jgi:hypothetical protein
VVTRRIYEFLHATFAEYLVAAHLVATVAQVAATVVEDDPRSRPDDDLLFALLCHQSIAIQQPVLSFVRAHYSTRPEQRHTAVKILERLIRGYRNRLVSRRFTEYRPTSRDHLRGLATYSANLFLLRVVATPGQPVKVSELWPGEDGWAQWRSCVALWQAGMDESGYRSTLSVFWQNNGELSELRHQLSTESAYEIHRSVLRDETPVVRALVLGQAILSQHAVLPPSWYLRSSPHQDLVVTLELLKSLPVEDWPLLDSLVENRSPWHSSIARQIWVLLCCKQGRWPAGAARNLAAIALDHAEISDFPELMAAAAFRHKAVYELLKEVKFSGRASRIYQLAAMKHDGLVTSEGWDVLQSLDDVVSTLLDENRREWN